MESIEGEVITTVYTNGAWYLMDLKTMQLIWYRYESHSDAVDGAEVRAYRLSQGWTP